jgi:hypothetical protein
MTYGTSYTVTATNSDDCISASSASFSIMNMLPTPDAPIGSGNCGRSTATISNYNEITATRSDRQQQARWSKAVSQPM